MINWENVLRSQHFAVKMYKDSVYRGEIMNSMRNGKGVITYKTSRVFEGDWKEDKRHGNGYERFSNGNTYIGMYK